MWQMGFNSAFKGLIGYGVTAPKHVGAALMLISM